MSLLLEVEGICFTRKLFEVGVVDCNEQVTVSLGEASVTTMVCRSLSVVSVTVTSV